MKVFDLSEEANIRIMDIAQHLDEVTMTSIINDLIRKEQSKTAFKILKRVGIERFRMLDYKIFETACFYHCNEIAMYFIKNKTKINIANAISTSSLAENFDMIEILISLPEFRLEDTYEAIKSSCINGNLKVLEFYKEKGMDIHYHNEIGLVSAIKNEQFKIAEYLIKDGANINEAIVTALAYTEVVDYLTKLL